MVDSSVRGGSKIAGRNMMGNMGRKVRGEKAMNGLQGLNKTFLLNMWV